MPDPADAEHQPSNYVSERGDRRRRERRTRPLPGGTATSLHFTPTLPAFLYLSILYLSTESR